jgi:hypothetical protein
MNDEFLYPLSIFMKKWVIYHLKFIKKKLEINSCHIYHLETTDFNRWVKTTLPSSIFFLEHHITICVCFEKMIDVFRGLL